MQKTVDELSREREESKKILNEEERRLGEELETKGKAIVELETTVDGLKKTGD